MSILPLDVVTDILLRLPAKIVIRFKIVCKLWYDLIDGPDFVKLHLERSLATQSNLHIVVHTPKLHLVDFDTFCNPVALDYPSQHLDDGIVHVVGACHGLLCLFYYKYDYCFILYNPTTQTHKLLPHLPVASQFVLGHFNFGFGYDNFSGEYKCVRILQTYMESGSFENEVMVYSMKNDLWRRVQGIPYYFDYHNGYSAFVGGAIHWVGQDENRGFLPIVCFDIKDETFSSIPLPELGVYSDLMHMSLGELGGLIREPIHMSVGVLDGCLCLMVNYCSISVVWIMEEYGVYASWKRLLVAGKRAMHEYWQRPLSFSINRKELFMKICRLTTVKIDMETKVATDVKVADFNRCSDAWVCVENLLMLNNEYNDPSGEQEKGRKNKKRKNKNKNKRRKRRRNKRLDQYQ